MSDHAIEPQGSADLRSRAASRLTNAAAGRPRTSITDAMLALYTLASSPQTASEALTLLHELQVHQVELDLQAEELVESRNELESALRRQIALYDLQPVGCFTIDRQLAVHELNHAGAAMLAIEPREAHGASLDHYLSPKSRRTLQRLVSGAVDGARPMAGLLDLCPAQGPARPVQADVRAEPDGQMVLVVLTNPCAERGLPDDGR
jgi:PAS domain-containing protein